MRITIAQGAFFPVPPVMGGAVEKAWFSLGQEFAAKGHQVCHLSRTYEGLSTKEYSHRVEYLRVRGYNTPRSLLKLKLLDLLYSLRVARALPEADILVTNTFWLPLLVRNRQQGRIYVHVARFPKGQLKYYPRDCHLQTVSSSIQRAITAELNNTTRRVSIIPYSLSSVYMREYPKYKKTNSFLYTGRLHPEKGLDLLLNSLQLLKDQNPEYSLRIVGPWKTEQGGGGERYIQELKQKAQDLPVSFNEPIYDEANLAKLYEESEYFLYPSLAEKGETFGLAILEAMGSGAIPIVSNLDCFKDFVQPGINGYIFDHRAEHPEINLSNTLIRALHARTNYAKLSSNAWTTARNYSSSKVADLYLSDFSLLSTEPRE